MTDFAELAKRYGERFEAQKAKQLCQARFEMARARFAGPKRQSRHLPNA